MLNFKKILGFAAAVMTAAGVLCSATSADGADLPGTTVSFGTDVISEYAVLSENVIDVTDAVADRGSKYLHVGNRPIGTNSSGFYFYPGEGDSGVYYIEFDARNSVDAEMLPTGKHFREASGNNLMTCVSVTDSSGNDCTSVYGTSVRQNIHFDSQWRHYVLKWDGAVSSFRFQGRYIDEVVNFDIDNFEYYKIENGSKKSLAAYDFEDGLVPETFSESSAKLTVLERENYKKSESGSLTFTFSEALSGGTYKLSADIRYAYSYELMVVGVNASGDPIKAYVPATVTVKATVDGEDVTVGTYDVSSNDWISLDDEIVVEKGSVLTALTFDTVAVSPADGTSLNNTPLDFRNVSLVFSIKTGTDVIADYAVLSEEVTDITDAAAVDGSRYLHVGDRPIGTNSSGFYFYPGEGDSGVYYIEFDARNSVDAEMLPTGKHFREASGNNLMTCVSVTDSSGNDCTSAYGTSGSQNIHFDSQWRHYVLRWDGAVRSFRFQGRYIAEVVNFDIDNFEYYKIENGSKKSLAAYNFEDGIVPDAFSGYGAVLSVDSKEDYQRSEKGTLTYTFSEGIPAGTYQLVGDVRYGYSYNMVKIGVTESGDQIRANVTADITVSATIDGNEVVIGTFDATANDWITLFEDVTIKEGSVMTAISFTTSATSPLEGEALSNTPIDFKNISLKLLNSPMLGINKNDIAKYQIVISKDAAPIVERAAKSFSDHVYSLIGTELPIVTDSTPEAQYEILVGTSNRAKSTEILKNREAVADANNYYYAEIMGDTLVLNAGDAYGASDAVEAVLTGYLFKGLNQIPKKMEIPATASKSGKSALLKPFEDMLHDNVEQPVVFTEDFDVDDGYFAEEDNTSYFEYKNGEYTVSAGAERRLSYIHVYEANVDYTAKIKYTKAGADGDMGLMLRYVADHAYAKAGYDFAAGEWYIEYREGEDFYTHRIASAKATLTPGTQYTVRFVVDKMDASLYVDGKLVASGTGMHHVTPGRIAVCAENADISVDDVSAVLLSGVGTVMKGIYHANLDKGMNGNGSSFIELSDGSVYFSNLGGKTPYISKDGGQSWQPTTDILGVSGYAHPLVLLNGDLLQLKSDGTNIAAYTSKDDGKTWTRTGTVCPIKGADGFGVSNMNDKIMQAPSTGRLLYAASTNANGDTVHLSKYYYSDDNGKTWHDFGMTNQDIEGLKGIDRFAESKMIECADGSLRVYSTWGGQHGGIHYFESNDGGKTWGPKGVLAGMYAPGSSNQIVRDPYGETEHTYYIVWVYGEPVGKSNLHRTRFALAKTTDGKNWEYLGDIWRWDCTYSHHNTGMEMAHIVNPYIGISEDALFIGTGISERLRPDGGTGTHGDQQNHIWVIKREDIPEGKPINDYRDVKVGAVYYEAVTYVKEQELIDGTSSTTFAPDTAITASAFTNALNRLFGTEKASASGSTVTVANACNLLAEYADYNAINNSGLKLTDFADSSEIPEALIPGVKWAVENGIYSGQNGSINHDASISRALAATLLYSYADILERSKGWSGDATGDGKTDLDDITYFARYIANWTEYDDTTVNLAALDLNLDGEVNSIDLIILARHLADWEGYKTLPYITK